MKIRNGFVSNSSSCSFILIAKDDNIKDDYKEHKWIKPIDLSKKLSYNRWDIKRITSVRDKVKYICAMYAYSLRNQLDDDVSSALIKIDETYDKIRKLCKKHGYHINIYPPLLNWSIITDKYCFNEEKGEWEFKEVEPYVSYCFNISTECTYFNEIKTLVDDEDTTRLEQFLFNPHSFGILGGDEYSKTYALAHEARQKVDKLGYEYERFADYPDYHLKKGDPSPWNGEPLEEDYINEWGRYVPEEESIDED